MSLFKLSSPNFSHITKSGLSSSVLTWMALCKILKTSSAFTWNCGFMTMEMNCCFTLLRSGR